MPNRHTIHLAEPCEATGYASAITPVIYGTAQLTGVAPGTAMAIRYHRERATATMDGWSYVHTAATPSVRILHDDVLVIGGHQFRVHCPRRMRVPELRLIVCRENLDGATALITASPSDREPTHHCTGCDIPLWLLGEDWIASCPCCGDEASPIVYCPDCERPGCRISGHGSNR